MSQSESPLILTDGDAGYAEDFVWIEVTPKVSMASEARAWAEGHFLDSNNEERPADGCPVSRVSLAPAASDVSEGPEAQTRWEQTYRDDPAGREFWEVDVSDV